MVRNIAHWCQLQVKVSLKPALSRSQSPTGNAFREAPPQDLRQSRNEVHFQPEAGNEVLYHV
ncbi:MAG: hypothetical protein V7K27_16720 [Nostoc sp.]|uniref:hypothetical protein n=1 Tax=Nostoc sp. TaxID=1180 RepID=UPI002FF8BE11